MSPKGIEINTVVALVQEYEKTGTVPKLSLKEQLAITRDFDAKQAFVMKGGTGTKVVMKELQLFAQEQKLIDGLRIQGLSLKFEAEVLNDIAKAGDVAAVGTKEFLEELSEFGVTMNKTYDPSQADQLMSELSKRGLSVTRNANKTITITDPANAKNTVTLTREIPIAQEGDKVTCDNATIGAYRGINGDFRVKKIGNRWYLKSDELNALIPLGESGYRILQNLMREGKAKFTNPQEILARKKDSQRKELRNHGISIVDLANGTYDPSEVRSVRSYLIKNGFTERDGVFTKRPVTIRPLHAPTQIAAKERIVGLLATISKPEYLKGRTGDIKVIGDHFIFLLHPIGGTSYVLIVYEKDAGDVHGEEIARFDSLGNNKTGSNSKGLDLTTVAYEAERAFDVKPQNTLIAPPPQKPSGS